MMKPIHLVRRIGNCACQLADLDYKLDTRDMISHALTPE